MGRGKETPGLGNCKGFGKLWNTAGDTLQLGIAGTLCVCTLQGYSAAGHCRYTLRLGSAGTLCICTLHAEILCGWALHGGRGEYELLEIEQQHHFELKTNGKAIGTLPKKQENN